MIEINLPRVHVVGMGEVGRRLAGALDVAGVATSPVTRTRGWDEARDDADGLCLVCVREDDLAGVLDTLHNVPSDRLVLIQNGWIRPLLHDLPDVTRGLIWFTAKPEFFQILRPNVFSGPWAAELALALAAGGLPSEAVGGNDFDALDADKMAFNCVVGLPLELSGLSLGQYLTSSPDQARAVFEEALGACAHAVGAGEPQGAWDRFRESARHLDWVRIDRAKALDFRNRAVVALAAEHGLAAPANADLLRLHGQRCGTYRESEAKE